jgi:DNA-directed RNA polymerase specialized sigma subunit
MDKGQISNTVRKLRFEHDEMTQKQLAERWALADKQFSQLKKTNIPHL